LKRGRRHLATIVPKDEFVKINLELSLAHTVVSAEEPLLQVANGSVSEWDGGLGTFS
jgi:hypothetical protein